MAEENSRRHTYGEYAEQKNVPAAPPYTPGAVASPNLRITHGPNAGQLVNDVYRAAERQDGQPSRGGDLFDVDANRTWRQWMNQAYDAAKRHPLASAATVGGAGLAAVFAASTFPVAVVVPLAVGIPAMVMGGVASANSIANEQRRANNNGEMQP